MTKTQPTVILNDAPEWRKTNIFVSELKEFIMLTLEQARVFQLEDGLSFLSNGRTIKVTFTEKRVLCEDLGLDKALSDSVFVDLSDGIIKTLKGF